MTTRHRTSAVLVAGAAVVLAVFASDAQALALGRVTVQSALGEPLRADIEVPEINADEVASFRAAVASPDAFRAAGLELSPAIANLQITLQRRADGRYFLRLSSERPVNDPFVDLILEANWSSGRIVRDFTMLFDPQNLRQNAQSAIAAQVSPVPAATPVPGAALPPRMNASPSRNATPSTSASPSATAPPRVRAPAPAVRAAQTPAAPQTAVPATAAAPAAASADGQRVKVQIGDTASKIAAAYKPVAISLDQMLVALLRGNPDAFISGNINRIKAGALVEVPNAEQASATSAGEASQTLIVQSRDFNEFRRRLAQGLPTAQVATADRQASGKLQAQVQEKAAATATPDKLTLSKGSLQDKAAEEKIVRDRAAQTAATRVAELNKNISDLNRLGTATGVPLATAPATTAPATAAPATAARPGLPTVASSAGPVKAASAAAPVAAAPAATPAAAVTAPVAATASVVAANAASAAKGSATAPATAAAVVAGAAGTTPAAPVVSSAPLVPPAVAPMPEPGVAPGAPTPAAPATATAVPPTPVAAALPATSVGTSLVDDLMENPLVPAAAGGLLALLLGFAFYRARQRKKSSQVDSSFLESRLQPDSFFGASGGQRIDTAEGSATGSSMVYLPSQLDSAGDVDPVAEADVYLAYGRDLQAEEILKEALRSNPQRVTIYAKLLEIYAKRRDAKAFAQIATDAFNLTRGEGPEWEHIADLGRELDPGNALYQTGGEPGARPGVIGPAAVAGTAATAATVATGSNSSFATIPHTLSAHEPHQLPNVADLDLDLDLDFSLDDDADATVVRGDVSRSDGDATFAMPGAPRFDTNSSADPGRATGAFAATDAVRMNSSNPAKAANGVDFDMQSMATQVIQATPPADVSMIEFDLGALSLDLDMPPAGGSASSAAAPAMPASDETQDFAVRTAALSHDTLSFNDDAGDDPLAVKLSLAAEFNAIGDPDGARSLAEEVVAEASGDLKSRAQRFLAEIA